MPGNISATYASPGLRHGLLLEDHPGVSVTFDTKKGTDLGVPPEFGGNSQFCVATIKFPPDTGRADIIGYKEMPPKGSADVWQVLCTKTLGRALKRAGYPDDTNDLKALVHWRQREAEIRAIDAGTAQLALPAAKVEDAITAAGTTKNAVSADDGDAPDTEGDAPEAGDDNITDAELVEDDSPLADPAKVTVMRQLIGQLPSDKQKEITAWSRKQGILTSRADLTDAQVDVVVDFIGKINNATENGHGSSDAKLIAELVVDLTSAEAKTFRKFCKDNGIDDVVAINTPGELTDEQATILVGWLDAGS